MLTCPPLLAATFVAALNADAAQPACRIAAQVAVEQAHSELWRRFVDEHNVLLDYCDLDGRIIRPTPQDCREHKPSALSWGVPIEDGPMFNGLYLDAMVNRWKLTRNEADRQKARRLVEGLLFLSSLGNTPGFIARGVATDGKTTYPMGSNDQTTPWLYGLWRYVREGIADPAERGRLIEKFCEQVKVLDTNGWRMPCDGGPSKYRGSFTQPTWEGAPRLLFVMKAMREFTGDAQWQQRYLAAANEKVGKAGRSRLEICRAGMVFDPAQGKRHSWTGSEGVVCLRALWEMETDPALRAAYAQGLRASAELAAQSLPLCREFDVHGKEHFEHDWRVMNEVWKPQHSEAETVEVANAGLRVQGRHSPRLRLEKDYLREPCFAAWVVTLCPDDDLVAKHRDAILNVITHYRYDRLYLSQFFPVESAWYRLALRKGNPPAAQSQSSDFINQMAAKLEPTRVVVYKKVAGRELHLNVFEPPGHKAGDRRSCFLTIHGGGWTGLSPRRQYPFAAHFAKFGMVAISIEYRLAKPKSGVTVFDCVKDGRSAMRYVRTHAAELGIDPQRIVANGGSAGGHLAAGTALFDGMDEPDEDTSVSCVPNALVLYFPVIDTSEAGYGNAKIGERWQEISPLHRVKPGVPPTIIFHGTADTVTPFKGAQAFHGAMLKAGNRCELVVHEGGKHGYLMFDRALYEETLRKTEAFMASLGLLKPNREVDGRPRR